MAKDNKSLSQIQAVARYRAKTYRDVSIKLRLEDDADIINALTEAKAKGISYREWLRELFENQK